MKFGSVCSGIESASMAWEPLGMRAAWFAEIEAFPSAVLGHHWPDVPNLGDMCNLPSLIAAGMIEAPDILVGGTPCQAFSVAGKRKGLEDERGQLTIKFVEIANEIDKQRVDNECVVVWENVPGVLSSKDNAFGCFLGELVGEECELKPAGKKWSYAGCVYGPKRTAAWRILDAQYFGVAQRRRRVFVVASARKGFNPEKVLFESEGLRRDIAPSREAGAETTGNVETSVGKPNDPSFTLTTGDNHAVFAFKPGQGAKAGGIAYNKELSPTLTATNSGTQQSPGLLNHGTVRRLTPIECERLQGFPDNHTLIPWAGKSPEDCPDGPRYKAIGNSKAVPVIQWVGDRICKHLNNQL